MSFDLGRALRLIEPEKRSEPLSRRAEHELRWADAEPDIGEPLLLDTSVYIDILQDRAPPDIARLLISRTRLHSSVCLAELTHLFGRLDPRHPATGAALEQVKGVIADIPAHRLHQPGVAIWGQAGILAGLLARLDREPTDDARGPRRLNDALICLQARMLGASVLSRNLRDMDFLNQLVPGFGVVFYERRRG